MFYTLKQFYDSDIWENFRKNLILERSNDNGVKCKKCNKHIVESKKIILHHVEELTLKNVNNYNISLNPENIEIICFDCHNKEHKRFGFGNKHLEKRHKGIYIVYGAPLAGKKTYVEENMSRGDIIIDMDLLFQAVSLMPLYDKPDNLKLNVFALRNLLIDNIKCRYGMFNSAWIIGGFSNRFDREKLAKELGAELIFIQAEIHDCKKRLEHCPDYRREHRAEWSGYIDKWFAEFQ